MSLRSANLRQKQMDKKTNLKCVALVITESQQEQGIFLDVQRKVLELKGTILENIFWSQCPPYIESNNSITFKYFIYWLGKSYCRTLFVLSLLFICVSVPFK